MRPRSHDCGKPTGIVSRVAHAARRPPVLALVIALISVAAAVVADPFPPYWGGGRWGGNPLRAGRLACASQLDWVHARWRGHRR